MKYDVLVIGGGIAGMESALNLGDMGYKVLLVEKEPSIGGKMILLSKVFPTLDCASCISTPKMAATSHHPNITLLTSSEVREVRRENGKFRAKIHRKAVFVDPAKCTGCQECEFACTVAVPDEYNFGLVARRAAFIPFPQAVPKKAVIEWVGTSPCIAACPTGIKAHGYISLARAGRFEKAFDLIMEDAPLVGTLGKACYAPCEGECTRGSLEGPLPIRKIKEFIAERYYEQHPEPEYGPPEELKDKRVAIIGSGPAGLTAAYFLARKGYKVTVFEAHKKPGGMLTYALPSFRLPKRIVERDIKNITALGVEIKTATKITSLRELKNQGFDAIFLAAGTWEARRMGIEGEDLEGVEDSIDFLKRVNEGKAPSLKGKTVLVVGGGNVAIDSARVALRLGASKVVIQYRRSEKEMPAFQWEVQEAEEEGVEFQYLKAPVRFLGEEGRVKWVESVRMRLGEPDESGRRRPIPIEGSQEKTRVDFVILAIGLKPSTSPFKEEVELNPNGTVKVNEKTLQTSLPYVFAGGDVVSGPSMIVSAMGQGKRAAHFIDLFLQGKSLEEEEYENLLPVVSREEVLSRQLTHSEKRPLKKRTLPPNERVKDFREVELPMSLEEVVYSASRCLDCGVCSQCHECIRVCPADAIDFSQKPVEFEVEAEAVVVSQGFKLFPAERKPQYGFGRFPNVINAMQMDRLLAPTRPYNTVLRPSDGKVPENIAFVLCTGSRDRTVGNPICSQVCCMYSIKQAQLLMGALPLADITIYYMDIRAFGKGYEEFFKQAADMGVQFVKGRVAKIEEKKDGNLLLYYEDIENGGVKKVAEHDLVVLSVGLLPNPSVSKIFKDETLELDSLYWIKQVEEDVSPASTSIEGVFVAGTAAGPKDIPDTILTAGAASAEVAAYIERKRRKG